DLGRSAVLLERHDVGPRHVRDLGMREPFALQGLPLLALDVVWADDDDLLLVETELDAAREPHLLVYDRGCNQQHDRDRELSGDQNSAEPAGGAAAQQVAFEHANRLESRKI